MGFEIVLDKKYFIYRVVMVCGDYLDQVKEYEREDGKKKDCFVFGVNFVGWEEFEDLKKFKEVIVDFVGNKNVLKVFINGIYVVCNFKKVVQV